MACGTGKTLTALWITEQLKPAFTLVLVPSLNLLSQTLSEWSKNTTSDWSYLCVCSDDTVNKSDDQPISTVDELPFEVTTNPDDIRALHAVELCRAGGDDEGVSHLVGQVGGAEARGAIIDGVMEQLGMRMARLLLPLRALVAFSSSVLTKVSPIDWSLLPTPPRDNSLAVAAKAPPTAGVKNNIASARHLLLTLQTYCNRERQQGSEVWMARARAIENLLHVTLALTKATTLGML